ncbi:integrase catalytic domain-containing protein [Nephila pilipes]|uniref:Integrase catalytic domain-containing protein n=1 Tax=Nephila pilipes TaxID=299642 RepID=A0A8X6U3G8_NEPPI|nr:integrase catalytic domain-containing protein [Nephila pilipes]
MAISGLTLNNENYDKAVEILKDRFGQKQSDIFAYMNTLLKLQPVQRSNDTSVLPNLYDKINNSMRSLESLGINTDLNGNLLYPILNRCIPVELMLLFNRQQVARDVKEPIVSDLLKFLKDEVEACERSFSEHDESPIEVTKSNYPPFKKTQFASFNKKCTSAATLNLSVRVSDV